MRLIDADALIAEFDEYIEENRECNTFANSFSADVAEVLRETVQNAPTIEQPTWISCAESLPETIACSAGTAYSEAVIVFTTGKKVMIAIFDGEGFLSDGIDYWDAEHDEVTHWMPLPMPPKGDE